MIFSFIFGYKTINIKKIVEIKQSPGNDQTLYIGLILVKTKERGIEKKRYKNSGNKKLSKIKVKISPLSNLNSFLKNINI